MNHWTMSVSKSENINFKNHNNDNLQSQTTIEGDGYIYFDMKT